MTDSDLARVYGTYGHDMQCLVKASPPPPHVGVDPTRLHYNPESKWSFSLDFMLWSYSE